MKPVKCDPELLRLARATLIEKLGPRLEPVMSDFDGHKSVSGFKDPEFVRAFGPGLDRLPESELVNQALLALIKQASASPPGKTGLPYFDDQPMQTQQTSTATNSPVSSGQNVPEVKKRRTHVGN